MPSDSILLSKATIFLQINQLDKAKLELEKINPKTLSQRAYLFHGCLADYHEKKGDLGKALVEINLAVAGCSNQFEQQYLERKKEHMLGQRNK